MFCILVLKKLIQKIINDTIRSLNLNFNKEFLAEVQSVSGNYVSVKIIASDATYTNVPNYTKETLAVNDMVWCKAFNSEMSKLIVEYKVI